MRITREENEVTETWRSIRKMQQEKRAHNRDDSAQMLRDAGIAFEVKNDGAHLIVADMYDFWPGTGLFMRRNSKAKRQRYYGVRQLISFVKGRV